ncbi:MAG: PilX N-terminal domain-containing pilus assembly protein [candidate division Zixibacteria bacterium]|nr:PilX N-terminal domain-containing pilus assembly protein [candidate division Zixibacteria bacterium]
MPKSRKLIDNRGMATFIVLIIMVMMTIIGIAIVRMSNDEITLAGNEKHEMSSFYAAEAGLERASAAIQTQYEASGGPPSTLPQGNETINDCVAAYATVDNGAATVQPLTKGVLAGLNALVKTFTITSIGISSIDRSQVVLTQEFNCDLVPIFQFAVFYGNDLEIAPGPDMTLIGRVHSNGNLYLQSNNNLYMDSYVTASGQIIHGRKGPGGTSYGDVMIKDADGNYQNMLANGTWLDASATHWYDSAAVRWKGRVQDSAFGQGELNLPLTGSSDPHKLIERATGNPDSYESLAEFKIIDGVAYAKIAGVWTNVNAALPSGTVSARTFYDAREAKTVNATDLDISKFRGCAYFPTNGVVYTSDHRSGFRATRLVSGDSLGKALSIVCENPLYIKGNFNSKNKKPAFVAGDAVTFLSTNWADTNSTKSLNSRVASNTTTNCSFLTGNLNTTSGTYNGGLENLPRFLEKWDSKTFKWRGSIVNLWNSLQAVGLWVYGGYYTAPVRDWAYDTDLDNPNNLPPETPMVRIFQRMGWQEQYIGYNH